MSPRTSQSAAFNNPYRGESFPIRELAQSLGCPSTDSYRLETTLKELCRTSAIRFGIPEIARNSMAEWLGLPKKTEITYPTINQPMDPRWVRLAEALELPKKGELPLLSLTLASQSALLVLKEATRELAEEIASLHLKPLDPILGEQLRASQDLRPIPEDPTFLQHPGVYPIALSAYRQARNFILVGPSFALVTSQEQFHLRGCALRNQEKLAITSEAHAETLISPPKPTPFDRRNEAKVPPSAALEHLGLIWRWKAERGAWEPALPQSKHQNATLFDESSRYFGKVLNSRVAHSYSDEKRAFLEALQRAREDFQLARAEGYGDRDALLRAQERILTNFLKR